MDITVYCGSSSGTDAAFMQSAADLGRWIAENGHTLVYGGGNVGLMGQVAAAALEAGGRVIGVIPDFLEELEVAKLDLTELIRTRDMPSRKAIMLERGDAYIALPGGLGTMEEIFEAMCARKLLLHYKPCIFFDVNGFYGPLKKALEQMAEKGFYNLKENDGIYFVESLGEIGKILEASKHPPLPRYRAAIFDLDGTLLDTLEDLYLSTNIALEENGLPKRTKDEIRSFVGNGIRLLIERAVPEGTDKKTTDAVHSAFIRIYQEHCEDHTAPYQGIRAMLTELKKRGTALGVVSNKADAAVQKLIAHYFPGIFDSVAGEKKGIAKKPAPDLIFACMKDLGAKASETLYVGDSEVDIQAAENAGLKCISAAWGFKDKDFLKKNGAGTIVDAPVQVTFEIW